MLNNLQNIKKYLVHVRWFHALLVFGHPAWRYQDLNLEHFSCKKGYVFPEHIAEVFPEHISHTNVGKNI